MGATVVKRPRPQLIKSARCYTVPELAAVVGASVHGVRNWVRAGLPALRKERPTLIRGKDAKIWLQARQAKKQTKLLFHEFLCLRCKSAKSPFGGMADCHEQTTHTLRLTALCPGCGKAMHRIIARHHLADFQQIFDVQIIDA
jgi:hypothetical protein